jgi:outer membrane protein OmpA-like peptidoglycan-associated protein
MNRVFLIIALFFSLSATQAQEKGLYLNFGGSAGWTNFMYSLDGGSYKERVGYGGNLGFQYFFTRHWGFSLAGEYTIFNTQSRYANKSFLFNEQVDNENDAYNLTVRLSNWKENQTTRFVEVPLMLMFQHKFGKSQRHGFYFGVGAKAQIPISNSFQRAEGEVRVSGYYPAWHLPLGEEGKSVELPQHGYGTNKDRLWEGQQNLKTGFAAVGELGFLFGLSRRVDLMLGASIDYGFTNISNRADNLVAPIDGKTQQDGSYVSEMITYSGVLNSDQTSYINTMSVRGKIGLRIKLGKLSPPPAVENAAKDQDGKYPKYEQRASIVDTIVIIHMPAEQPQPQAEKKDNTPADNLLGKRETKTAEPLPQAEEEDLIESIYFDLNQSVLTTASKEVLDRKVALMRKYPQTILFVVGHTCDIGSSDYNNKLSYNRAEAAKVYLIKKGISPQRIIVVPQGMDNPTYSNSSQHGKELNRRVDFYLEH